MPSWMSSYASIHMPSRGGERSGRLWLEMFRRTLGRFQRSYTWLKWKARLVGFIVARLKRVPEYWGV